MRIEHKRISEKRRRQQTSSEEKSILEAEYQKNPTWDYQKKCDLALRLNFTFCKIGKWNWDRRKKEEAQILRQNKKDAALLTNDETH